MLRTISVIAVILHANALAAFAQAAAPSEPLSALAQVLTHETVIRLPDYPWHFAWSPDGKTVVVTQFNKGELRLVDIEKRTVSEPVLRHFSAKTAITWSPRGDYIVGVGGTILRLFSLPDWSEVGRLVSPHDSCRFQTQRAPAFTEDGRHIWVSCRQNDTYQAYTAAIKLSVPGLKIVDRLSVPAPIPGRRTNVSNDTLQLQDGSVLLSTIVTVQPPTKQSEPETLREILRVYDLTRRIELARPIDLTKLGSRHASVSNPQQALLALQSKTATVRGLLEGYQITIIDLVNGERLFALARADQEDFTPLSDIQVTTHGPWLIGSVSRKGKGGLYVWELRTGKVLQRVLNGAVSWIGLSPNQQRLIAIVLNELHVYRVGKR